MRERLASLQGCRRSYTATFVRLSKRNHRSNVPMALFRKVCVTGRDIPVTDHVWVPYCTRLSKLNLKSGDKVTFEADVSPYVTRAKIDFSLSRIRNAARV